MVIKKTNGSGGYGMLMGSAADEKEIEEYKAEVIKEPRDFIAQPIISLSSVSMLYGWKIKTKKG